MDGSVTGSAPAAGELVGFLRRRWLLLITGFLLGAALVGAAVITRPFTYTATATVLVTPTGVDESAAPANGQGTRTGVNLDTEAKLVESIAVAERTKALLKTDRTTEALTAAVKAEIPANTSILRISFKARTAAGAQRGAQAFATAYLDHRRAVAAASLSNQVKSVQQQVTSLRAQLQTIVKKMAATSTKSPDRAFTQSQADVLTSQIAALTDRLSTLQSTTITPGGIIVNAAIPTAPTSPSPVLLLVVAGAVLLFGMLALAVLRDRADLRLHTSAAVERRTGRPVLLNLARVAPLELNAGSSGPGQEAREFRRLQNTLTAALPGQSRVVLVTAAAPGGSAALVATNLAGALGRGGSSAVLICSDPASWTGAELVGAGPGLAEALTGTRTLADLLRPLPSAQTVRVLTQGNDTTRLAVRLQTAAAGTLLAAARELADWVVIELAAATSSADAQTLARWADAAIVVVEAGQTRYPDARDALNQLDQVGLHQLGCALVPGWTRGLRTAPPPLAPPAPLVGSRAAG